MNSNWLLTGQYAELDKDFGDKIYYSGSKSLENTDPTNPVMTTSTRSLQTSKREDRSVRVIRAAGGNSDYSPSCGFRYDGLYKIIEERLPKNKKGGCYIRFTLQRKDGQPDIDKSRPNREERAIFSRLKEFWLILLMTLGHHLPLLTHFLAEPVMDCLTTSESKDEIDTKTQVDGRGMRRVWRIRWLRYWECDTKGVILKKVLRFPWAYGRPLRYNDTFAFPKLSACKVLAKSRHNGHKMIYSSSQEDT